MEKRDPTERIDPKEKKNGRKPRIHVIRPARNPLADLKAVRTRRLPPPPKEGSS
jgi:hypothetical protein